MTKKDIPTNINKYPHKFFEHVRWGDTDGYQHVNNVSISRYFESASRLRPADSLIFSCDNGLNSETTPRVHKGFNKRKICP